MNAFESQFVATAENQYGRALASGEGPSREVAEAKARKKAREVIRQGNPHWKWRIARVILDQTVDTLYGKSEF